VVKKGFFKRRCDGRRVQRFMCKACRKLFSSATFSRTFRQHKPYLNGRIVADLCSGQSQRRIAYRRKINRKTVARKLIVMAHWARVDHAAALASRGPAAKVQFDDMETSEHTKLKPLAIPLLVAHPSRWILGWDVCAMPCKGRLAAISRKKYGPRADERPRAWRQLYERLSPHLAADVAITSDSHPSYPAVIHGQIPGAKHVTVKSRRAADIGQGELKVGGYDPIFTLNHTAAMLRANINRLFRRTWCTTKKAAALADHIALYVRYHNTRLLPLAERQRRPRNRWTAEARRR
jgi:hypothetical protein